MDKQIKYLLNIFESEKHDKPIIQQISNNSFPRFEKDDNLHLQAISKSVKVASVAYDFAEDKDFLLITTKMLLTNIQ